MARLPKGVLGAHWRVCGYSLRPNSGTVSRSYSHIFFSSHLHNLGGAWLLLGPELVTSHPCRFRMLLHGGGSVDQTEVL